MLATKNRMQALGLAWLGTLLFLTACSRSDSSALLAGKKLLDAGKNEPAIVLLERVTQTSPTNAVAWNYLGVAYHQTGQWTNAVNAYAHALRWNRELLEVRFNLGCLWLEQNRWAEAKSELTAYTLRRGEDGAGWAKLGMAQYQLREAAAAEKSFQTALRLQATNAEAWNGLGLLQAQRSHWRNATESFATALKWSPHYPAALLNLAVAEQQQGHNSEALQLYHEYLGAQPRPADWEAVAAVVEALSPTRSAPPPPPNTPPPNAGTTTGVVARSATLNVKETAPPKPPAVTNSVTTPAPPKTEAVAVTPRPANRVAPARGATQLVSEPVLKPESNHLHAAQLALQAGQQAQRDRRLADAAQAYRRAIALEPGMFEAHYCLGLAAYEMRDFSTASQAWAAALRLRSTSADTRYNYALSLKAEAKYAQAITELERLVTLHPDEARGHLMLGILYSERIIDVPKARLHFNRVLQLEPQNSQAPAIRSWLASHPG